MDKCLLGEAGFVMFFERFDMYWKSDQIQVVTRIVVKGRGLKENIGFRELTHQELQTTPETLRTSRHKHYAEI